jgi:hypothetical protein
MVEALKGRSNTAQGGAQRNPGASGTFRISPERAAQKAAEFCMCHLVCCTAPAGMRVKLSRIPKALQARCSKAQGGGARTAGSGTLGFRMELRFSPERATQAFA